MSGIAAFLKNDSGSSSIEYGLIVVGISLGIIGIHNLLSPQLRAAVWSILTQLDENSPFVVE
jgi:Flp pilus assembly pilin Flp